MTPFGERLAIAALNGPDESVGKFAAEALVKIGAPAVEPLIVTMSAPDVRVRKSAVTT